MARDAAAECGGCVVGGGVCAKGAIGVAIAWRGRVIDERFGPWQACGGDVEANEHLGAA